ncbi:MULTISPECIES: hypothetical protein [Clostridium]|jgi:hypothetical protein|uniref:hypothetical protein n=1 Tax=Clostridium TaxID=1485 RepID=UPI00242BB61B|nr:hypothetical protein [Clostridium tyrobutyricum]
MNLSEVIKETQGFIDKNGDREISGIDVSQNSFSFSVTNINKIFVISDGRKSVIEFTA